MNIAIILAGGTGSRMGTDKPKQFIEVDGRSVIERCIDAFEAAPGIDEIAVVMHPQWTALMHEVAEHNTWKKLKKILEGGSERYMSSLNAIAAYIDYPDDTNLLLHDAARPWVSQEVIARTVQALTYHEAVAVGIPSTDTVWEVRQDFDKQLSKFIVRIPERSTMWRAQTPQAFRLPLIRDAYQHALQDPQFHATDDCGVVRNYLPGTKIIIVPGEEQNRKITFKEDLL
jgi:2-C-methyl-D-erythritol 4-phosphate cytidylyltransferase